MDPNEYGRGKKAAEDMARTRRLQNGQTPQLTVFEGRLNEMDSRLQGIEGQVEALVDQGRVMMTAMGVHIKEHPDGSQRVRSKLLKLDWKFALSILGASSGIALVYKILIPAIWAFLVQIHHALMGVG